MGGWLAGHKPVGWALAGLGLGCHTYVRARWLGTGIGPMASQGRTSSCSRGSRVWMGLKTSAGICLLLWLGQRYKVALYCAFPRPESQSPDL